MNSSDIFLNLNAHQIVASTSTEGKVRVVAGAGSGKTRVLAHRYAYIVNELGISPGNVLCMTFTNKAAHEMRHRISTMVDRGHVNDFICTIHGFCVKFLRREIYRIGYPKSFSIIDEEDAKQLAKEAMEEFGIDRRKLTAERFLLQVAGLKGYDPTAYIQKHLLPGSNPDAPDALVRYMKLQLKYYTLDFDDLLYFTIYIMEHFPEAKAYWTDKLNYIMVDEGQDCSGDDWRLLRLLMSHHHNLFVVGDPDQCIYEWRGACPRLFIDFDADKDVVLNENYRSTPQILDVANVIIANNHNRIPKELFTSSKNGNLPIHYHAQTEKDEVKWIAETIEDYHKKGWSYSDFAVLFRSAFMSRQLEQALLRLKIPYSVWGGARFYERREIKDVISYLRLIDNPDDDISFSRIVNVPSRKFGKVSMQNLRNMAQGKGMSLYAALASTCSEGASLAKPQMVQFVASIEKLRMMTDMLTPSEMADEMMKMFGLTDLYRTDREEERLENIAELINSMQEYELSADDEEDVTLHNYLQDIALYTDADFYKKGESVRTITIHQAKGLEFKGVFVMGLSEGQFPNHRTIRERRKDGEEEERRLMYVAVTRAKKQLFLSDSEGHLNENSGFKYPSRFLAEIPDTMIRREGEWDPELLRGTRAMMHQLEMELGGDGEGAIPAGSRVRHKIFGEGEVIEYDANSDSYKVQFATATRNLMAPALQLID